MSTVHLLDNTAFSWNGDTQPFAQTRGVAFSVNLATQAVTLRWYRQSTGANRTPSRLDLWDLQTGTSVAGVSSPADNGSVGWQESTLSSPVDLIANRPYAVSGDWATSDLVAHIGQTSIPTPPGPLVPAVNFRCYSASGTHGVPITFDTANIFNIDVGVVGSTTNPPGGGATSGDVANALADWLSVSDNTHGGDSAPIATQALAAGSSGFDAIKGVVDTINSSVGSGLGSAVSGIASMVSIVAATVGTINSNLASHMSTWSTALATALQTASDNVVKLLNGTPPTAPFPGGNASWTWALADEIDFDTDLAWAVEADRYVVHITTPPPGMAADSFGGVNQYYRLGSWAELNGTHIVGERRFLEFEFQELDAGRRMAGLALRCKVGTLGHVQAFTLT